RAEHEGAAHVCGGQVDVVHEGGAVEVQLAVDLAVTKIDWVGETRSGHAERMTDAGAGQVDGFVLASIHQKVGSDVDPGHLQRIFVGGADLRFAQIERSADMRTDHGNRVDLGIGYPQIGHELHRIKIERFLHLRAIERDRLRRLQIGEVDAV